MTDTDVIAYRDDGLAYRIGTADEWIMRESGYNRLLQTVTPADHVLDLGGYIGTFAVAARKVGAMVTSVEASPRNCAVLVMNAIKFGFRPIHAAVTVNNDASVTFYESLTARQLPYSSLQAKANAKDYRQVIVPAIHVHDLQQETRATVVKIDVEGTEVSLLRTLDLAYVRAVAIEYNLSRKGQLETAIDAEKSFLSKGFTVRPARLLSEHGGKPRSLVKIYFREDTRV
jgi:FkbM family methyltransferase